MGTGGTAMVLYHFVLNRGTGVALTGVIEVCNAGGLYTSSAQASEITPLYPPFVPPPHPNCYIGKAAPAYKAGAFAMNVVDSAGERHSIWGDAALPWYGSSRDYS